LAHAAVVEPVTRTDESDPCLVDAEQIRPFRLNTTRTE
jgi:hypothetical protein